jgi:hypothetical protein
MKLNGKWQTRHDLNWFSDRLFEDTFPKPLIIVAVAFQALFLLTVLVWFLRRMNRARAIVTTGFILLLAAGNGLVYSAYALRQKSPVPVVEVPGPVEATVTTLMTKFEQLTAIPAMFVPLGVANLLSAVVLASIYLLAKRRLHGQPGRLVRMAMIWLIPTLWYVYLYYLLPFVQLIDIRAVPQVHLYGCIFAGVFAGYALRFAGRIFNVLAVIPLVVLCLWGTGQATKNLPNWLRWNLSGWHVKDLHPVVMRLSDSIRGDFSDPRAIYELSDRAQATGTIRVWEMLPYFAGRATLESVYLEATLLSPEAVYLQAEISKQPSCPLPQFPCPRYNMTSSKPRMALMGVGDLILATDETKKLARAVDHLEEKGTFGTWTIFSLRQQPALVEVFRQRPELAPEPDWRDTFYQWFISYDGTQPSLISAELLDPGIRRSLESIDESERAVWEGGENCHPSVEVEFNKIVLRTDCPGRAHFLKFNFHPAWRTSTGDPLFIVSPAFIGIIPSQKEVTLEFGYLPSWLISQYVSLLSLLGLTVFTVAAPRKKRGSLHDS